MQTLIQSLTHYFDTNKHYFKNKNKSLKNFVPIFQKVFDKINFKNKKNELLVGTYTRDVLYTDNQFEIIFITWGVFSESKIHTHPENGCILTLLNGNLIEERYNKEGKIISCNFLKENDIGYMENSIGTHRIKNNNEFNVYSLHIYSPPNYYNKKYEPIEF